MRFLLGLTSLVVGFLGSAAVLLLVPQVIRALPLSGPSWPQTPIQNLTYGEFLVWLFLILAFAYGLGLVLGKLFGNTSRSMMTAAALLPALATWFAFIANSLGMALFFFPIPIAYGAAVYLGARHGGKGRTGTRSSGST